LEKKFLTSLGVLTLGLALVMLLLQYFLPNIVFIHSWFLLLYFCVITFISHLIMLKGTGSKDPIDSYNATMGSTALRLFLGLAIVITYIYLFNYQTFNFAITFFVFYAIFTAFELKTLLANLRK
jgi:hypothetical protein